MYVHVFDYSVIIRMKLIVIIIIITKLNHKISLSLSQLMIIKVCVY